MNVNFSLSFSLELQWLKGKLDYNLSCSLDPTSNFETMNSELQNAQLKGFYYDVLELYELSCGLWAITIVGKL